MIVEGKYDKNAVLSVCDAAVITTDGFGVFKNEEKRALIRRISENGVILLCDSDGAGKLIRAHLSGLVRGDKIYQLYVPQIKGKERRKRTPSAEGYLGVEGVGAEVLRECVLRLVERNPEIVSQKRETRENITQSDMYFARLSGGENASVRRDGIAEKLSLPKGLSAKALLCAMNMIIDKKEFLRLIGEEK